MAHSGKGRPVPPDAPFLYAMRVCRSAYDPFLKPAENGYGNGGQCQDQRQDTDGWSGSGTACRTRVTLWTGLPGRTRRTSGSRWSCWAGRTLRS